MAALIFKILTLFGTLALCRSQLELDERFLEYRNHGMWLVEFYAPWCGHCKKLEPIYQEVARELHKMNSPVRVAKLDCTRFSQVASEFSVRGFPTIMFINGNRVFTHRGERSKEEILEFALRAQGPAVRKLSSVGKFNEALSQHSSSVFFLFIGTDDEHNDLFTKYKDAADTHTIHSYFYQGKKNIIENRQIKRHPTMLVFKDQHYYEYQPPQGVATGSSVEAWINRERYPAFPKSSGPGLNEMSGAAEYIVILAAEAGELHKPDSKAKRVYDVIKQVAFGQKERFHIQFQFVWMDETETLSSIASSFLASPSLLALRTDDQMYYMPTGPLDNLTVAGLTDFLTGVSSGNLKACGGNGFGMRVWRLFFDIASTILGIWQASRWLFLLMFGLPTAIISIICYSLCCMEAIDDGTYDSEDEEGEWVDEEEENAQLYDIAGPPALSRSGPPPPYESLPNAQPLEKQAEEKKNE